MAGSSPNIVLLQSSVDPDDESYFRILVDDEFVKYITIDAGLYDVDDMCFGPSLVSLLPPLPAGDWNKAQISRNLDTGDPHFSAVANAQIPGITNTWHPTRIDHLRLREVQKLRTNVYEVTCPGFDTPLIAKFARFEWEVPQLDAETEAYSWIENRRVGPDFLGHIVEQGRVIGFLVARLTDFHHATMEDFAPCRRVLSRLHGLGIKHGDINKYNFLIQEDEAILIDFDFASRVVSESELQAELEQLRVELCDASGRGGMAVEDGANGGAW